MNLLAKHFFDYQSFVNLPHKAIQLHKTVSRGARSVQLILPNFWTDFVVGGGEGGGVESGSRKIPKVRKGIFENLLNRWFPGNVCSKIFVQKYPFNRKIEIL